MPDDNRGVFVALFLPTTLRQDLNPIVYGKQSFFIVNNGCPETPTSRPCISGQCLSVSAGKDVMGSKRSSSKSLLNVCKKRTDFVCVSTGLM